jgi:hypothetical protein
MRRKFNKLLVFVFAVFVFNMTAEYAGSQNVYNGVNLDTVHAKRFDMGRMWTFDNPPVDYFAEAYGFTPTKEWLDHVRMSALRFATYCSASFVSGDGLVMTNHHCGRESVSQVEEKGEDLHTNGFLALTIDKERKVPGLFVDQLVQIIDVTKEVQAAFESGKTNDEKVANKDKKVKELEKKYAAETGMKCQMVTFYNGGEYSIYVYKRYNDVRLVFAPEDNAGFFGGDPDNFTYPRYNLDCTFFRVYDESGNPLKTEHFYKWSMKGAGTGEPIFVVGNPGRTNRLNTLTQLEIKRDFQYPDILSYINFTIAFYEEQIRKNPESAKDLNNDLFSFSNSQKVYIGEIKALNDPLIIARKKDFEKKFKNAVMSNSSLKAKYGNVWDEIAAANSTYKEIYPEYSIMQFNNRLSSKYFAIAEQLVSGARGNQPLDEAAIEKAYKDLDADYENMTLEFQLNRMIKKVGVKNEYVGKLTNGKTGKDAYNYVIGRTIMTDKDKVIALSKKGTQEILKSDDPIIKYVVSTRDRFDELMKKADAMRAKEKYYNELLGRAVFDVYGNSVPPDATFTLRIADGVIQSYPYNGTTAPPKTTFYGIYDRYYGFNKEYPWVLPERWVNPPKDFKLETSFNFISTNDIIGGNSGSPVINKDAEIVGLAFDGNMESLPGDFIFTEDISTCVSLDSEGMVEALKDLYKINRIALELRNGGIVTNNK